MTQGVIAALVAQNTLPHLKGTAFALYYLVSWDCCSYRDSIAGLWAGLSRQYHWRIQKWFSF